MSDRADAPRLRAYLQHIEGNAVLTIPREDWDRFQVGPGDTVLVDVTKTPMGQIASDATVVATVARQFSDATAEVTIYRDDPADAPKRINADNYVAWLDLPSHQSFPQMLVAASTRDNRNLRDFLGQNVLLIKQPADAAHHDTDLPPTVKMVLKPPTGP